MPGNSKTVEDTEGRDGMIYQRALVVVCSPRTDPSGFEKLGIEKDAIQDFPEVSPIKSVLPTPTPYLSITSSPRPRHTTIYDPRREFQRWRAEIDL